MWITKKIKLLSEEILPFLYYWIRKKRGETILNSDDLFSESGKYSIYFKLTEDELKKRLGEEHERAKLIDEKTSKMTLSLTIALAVLGSTTSLLVKNVSTDIARMIIDVSAIFSIIYALIGGLLLFHHLKLSQHLVMAPIFT